MPESYYKKCGSCVYCNLRDKNFSEFRCTAVSGRWVLATEQACSRLVVDSNRTPRDIDYAREHTNGLA